MKGPNAPTPAQLNPTQPSPTQLSPAAASSLAAADSVQARAAALEKIGARLLLITGAVLVTIAPLLMAAYGAVLSLTPLAEVTALLLPCVLGAAFLGAGLWLRRGHARRAYALVLCAGFGVVVIYAAVTEVGVHSVSSGVLLMFITAAGVLLSAQWALGLGTLSALAFIALYFAETQGLIAGRETLQTLPVLSRTVAVLLTIAISTLMAVLMARLVVNAWRESVKQEQRFRGLLSIASDWSWEQDTSHRFTRISHAERKGLDKASDLGCTLWTLPGVDDHASDWTAHQQTLHAHQTFRDFHVYRLAPNGRRVVLSFSGEPVWDARGQFAGYWGVARDVTQDERARAALHEGDERFRELFMLSPSPFILHRGGRVLLGNLAATTLFGFADQKDFVDFDLALLTAPEDRALSRDRIRLLEHLPTGRAVPTVELAMLRLDGTSLTVEARVVRVDLADGPASLSLYFDLTQRKQAEAELLRSRTMFSRLFQTSPDYVTVSDIDTGYLEMVNQGFEQLTGYTSQEAVGRTVFELGLWPEPEQRDILSEAVRHSGTARDVPALLKRRNGELRKVLFCAARFDWEERRWMVVTARDITASERERLQYEAILSNALVGVALVREQKFEHTNLAFERMFGWPHGALVGQSNEVLWPSGADYAEVERSTRPALERGEAVNLERPVRRQDGSIFLCRFQARSLDPRAPRTSGSLWIAEDVTEQRAQQERLVRSETLLSLVMESNPDYVALSELDTGRFLIVNEGFKRMTGFNPEEVRGRTSFELGLWSNVNDRKVFVEQLQTHGAVDAFPMQMRTKSGRLISAVISAATFLSEGKTLVTSTARDVTESEHARLEYEAILANASIGIAFTRDDRFAHANPRFAEMFGWPASALTDQAVSVIWLSEQDFAEMQRISQPKLERGEAVELERRVRRQDGSAFWCRLQMRAIDPTHPSHGGTIWIADDVTEQRNTQDALASAKADAEAASRAKSAFLANTSHEIRTPLNGLLGLARLAVEPNLSDMKRVEYLRGILNSAEQLAGLISDILDLSKIEAGKLTLESVSFDLHALLSNVYSSYRELGAEKGLTCALHLDARVPQHVVGDPMRVRQIISNFVSNALKFTDSGYVDLCAETLTDGRIRLAVVDTGIGIDEATQARLFNAFTQADESTTRRFGGTGLGLSICRQIAQLMNGQVGVDSERGTGSTFWAELPLATTLPPPKPVASTAEISLRGIRVLLVEDNAVNQELARAMLQEFGCSVDLANNGREALEILAREAFEIVLMDCQMPEMDGLEAVRLFRAGRTRSIPWATPIEAPIIALTANVLQGDDERCRQAGFTDYLGKPFRQEQLAEMLLRYVRRGATAPGSQAPMVALNAASALPTCAADEVIHADIIERIRAMEARGAPQLLSRLIHTYLDTSERLLSELRHALNAGNAVAARQAAHTLKSTSANLGATQLAALCAQLEQQARNQQLRNADESWPLLVQAHGAAVQRLREIALSLTPTSAGSASSVTPPHSSST